MELKEFIKTAITDITEAVSELQSELNNGAIVNPTLPNPIALKTLTVDNEIRPIEQLAFDVAVTATEASGIDGSAKAGISIFGAKIGTESSAKTENVSRLTFSVPIVFPTTHVKTPQEIMREKRPKRPTD
ncbi:MULTISPECIES: hypothetical protein [Bacteroidales]|uniref:Uncharacterized protein n=1 Tax=Duncaniella muris TaxID=2094150 RepID=A0A2V1IRJ4_9BACT|nr:MULTISPECIES: hypothetical protein [Bacteroidales]PWB04387.1 hypothetical protein C5O23_00240 [Duncaniella muris]RXE73399.1 hypothetical protein ED551_08950 [Muribaculaceae bacterium Isolate-013 (NCI)]